MPKIKEVYEYSNGSWANGTPIGADASNVDVELSDSTSTRDLQTVLGNVSVSDPSMKTQLTGKVNASGGDIKDTVVSVLDPASETDTSEDINSTDVVVAAGESQTTMWSKFNMFRKRVSNKFSNFLISSVEDVVTPSDTKTYSQAALNSYFADVIGYKTDADVATVGSVADQLSTLNNKFPSNGKYDAIWFGTWSHSSSDPQSFTLNDNYKFSDYYFIAVAVSESDGSTYLTYRMIPTSYFLDNHVQSIYAFALSGYWSVYSMRCLSDTEYRVSYRAGAGWSSRYVYMYGIFQR